MSEFKIRPGKLCHEIHFFAILKIDHIDFKTYLIYTKLGEDYDSEVENSKKFVVFKLHSFYYQ